MKIETAPRIRVARFEDCEQILRLEAIINPNPVSAEEWRMLWQGSPLWSEVKKRWPIGWVFEDSAGEIVGCFGNIPLLYHLHGERLIAATARGWVVKPGHRGRYAVRLSTEHLHQPGADLCIDTSVGPMALACSDKYAKRIPVGDWESIAYCVTGYRAFATRALRRLKAPLAGVLGPLAGAALRIKDLGARLPKPQSSYAIESTDRFDSRFDTFWNELLRQKSGTLLAARDSATLSWHFSRPMSRGRVWVLTASRDRQVRAYAAFVRQNRGDELSRVRLADYQSIDPEVDLLPDLLRCALQRCRAEDVCVLDKPGVGISKVRAFDEFAPYRRKQSWPMFYLAVDPELAGRLAQPNVWDPSEYDGDATLD